MNLILSAFFRIRGLLLLSGVTMVVLALFVSADSFNTQQVQAEGANLTDYDIAVSDQASKKIVVMDPAVSD